MRTMTPGVDALMNALDRGTLGDVFQLLTAAFERDMAALRQRRIRAEAVADKLGEASARALIAVADRRGNPLYITGVSYQDGEGYKVKKITYSGDRAKAVHFSKGGAEAVARHLCFAGYIPRFEAR